MQPPIAKKVPVARTLHGETIVDDYGWLRDLDDPDTLAYLEAENAHTEAMTAHLADLRVEIYAEIDRRTLQTDLSAPARKGEWWYASRTVEGLQYPINVRMRGGPDGPEQVLLDVNALAEGHDFMAIGVFAVSPDGGLLAYSTDPFGSEDYTIRIKDLGTGEDLDDELLHTYYSAAWSADGRHLFYTTLDAAHRPDTVWRHRIGTPQTDDVVAVHEPDEHMFLSVGTSQDERYLLVSASSQMTADVRYLASDDPSGEWAWVEPRRHGVEYRADHKDGRWLVATNDGAADGRLVSIAVGDPSDRVDLLAHEAGRKVEGVLALSSHIVVQGRVGGRTAVIVIPDGLDAYELSFPEEVHAVRPEVNLEYDTDVLRVRYESLVTPRQILDVDLVTGERTVVKATPVLGGFESVDYVSRREWALAEDGTRIPLSIVHRADLDLASPQPLLLYGYGSYEASIDPTFSIPRLSLLDRGVVYAIAHIRGGGEMGRAWYEGGKLEAKATTFTDFVAAADHLVSSGVTAPDRLVARGASAGGLLMGAVANLRPELFAGIVAEVPFVDVVSTMLDESLPLTVIEFEEWGNPKESAQYEWIRAYSPYDNVAEAEYPAMLATAGLNDPRVSYWEPAKWVAKLRAVATNRGPLLLRTEMGAGHGGPSGRYDAWRDEAFTLAFVLDVLGLSD